MFKSIIFLLLISSVTGQVLANCDAVVESIAQDEAPTISFLSLLQNMVENQHMSVDQYQAFIHSVEAGVPKFPWKPEELATHSSLYLFGKMFSDYLDYWSNYPHYINKETVLRVGRENLQKWGREKVNRVEVRVETKRPVLRMEYVKIKAGKLTIDKGRMKEKIIGLGHEVEVQKYLVTQSMWAELMEENPSEFARGEDEITINFNGKNVTMQPNHPVEMVSVYSAMVYANRLSEKEGYKPVYDFSQVTKSTGRPGAGDYAVHEGKIGFNKTDGYRLPTLAESEYLARGRKKSKYSFGDDMSLLDKYEWYAGNSDGHTHAVGEKLPNPFGLYDVHGNVQEWVVGLDFTIESLSLQRMFRGGAWNYFARSLYSSYSGYGYGEAGEGYSTVGFRLLRRIN